MDYWTYFEDPIYDIDGDDSREENVDYVTHGQLYLVGACAEISWGNLQLCLSMFNSENFRFVEHICDD